jgi:hypothetical protein
MWVGLIVRSREKGRFGFVYSCQLTQNVIDRECNPETEAVDGDVENPCLVHTICVEENSDHNMQIFVMSMVRV